MQKINKLLDIWYHSLLQQTSYYPSNQPTTLKDIAAQSRTKFDIKLDIKKLLKNLLVKSNESLIVYMGGF